MVTAKKDDDHDNSTFRDDASRFLTRSADKLSRKPYRFYRTTITSLVSPNMVFVWIPKTAGTSLFAWLEKEVYMAKLNKSMKYVRAFKNRGAVTFGHYHYKSLVVTGNVSKKFDASAFKFCVSRNPYDRAMSLYFYSVREKLYSGEFVDYLAEVQRNRPPVGMYNVLGLSQSNPQVDWMFSANGEFVVDKVYRFEDLNEIATDLQTRFGSIKSSMEHRNKTERGKSARELLTSHSEIVPLIKDIYARDFDVLDYSLDLPPGD